jgi:hypothetical protein
MKKLCLLFLLVLLSSSGIAQSSIRFSLGYGLPLNSDLIMEQYTESLSSNDTKVKGIYGSMGSGLTVNAAFGHTLGKGGFGWELESTFLLGKKYKSNSLEYNAVVEKTFTTQNSLCFQITPSLTYSGTWKKLTPYVRLGPTIGINKIFVDVTAKNADDIEFRYQYTGGVSLGLKTAVGAAISVSPSASFFWEISFINMAYAPKKAWLTDFEVNGQSQLKFFTDEERTIKLEKSYTLDPDSDEVIQTQDRYSMGAIALNLGFKFTL